MAEILLNFFDNIILAAAVEEVVPAVGFFKDRYCGSDESWQGCVRRGGLRRQSVRAG